MKKIFILLPDGVGLKNFALTSFNEKGEKLGYEIVYWNNTVFDIATNLGYDEVIIEDHKTSVITQILTRAKKRIELNIFDKKFNETVYRTYKFPLMNNSFNSFVKSFCVRIIEFLASNEKGNRLIRKLIKKVERSTLKYNACKIQLEIHKPDFVFCTNPRIPKSIAPILAAEDLGIETGTFIFSWDNLPKATTLIEPKYYFVWSEFMKNEVIKYLPFAENKNIFSTGTPQFENHFNETLIIPKQKFFDKHDLDQTKKYICFSGDDTTTSPLDQYYLKDCAISVRDLNKKGHNLGIIFRKCPIDFTGRYDAIIKEYEDVIESIDPLWVPLGNSWDQIRPTKEDLQLQVNICKYTEFVINICSTMVFDYIAHNKTCLYLNYEQPQLKKGMRDIGQNYKYIHFRSMPSSDSVVWGLNKLELTNKIEKILNGDGANLENCQTWFKIVAGENPENSSDQIWNQIDRLLQA